MKAPSPDDNWAISISREEFAKISGDSRLPPLIVFARVVNALRFAQIAALQIGDLDTPSNSRQRTQAFIYLAALFAEARKVAETVGAHFRHLPAYSECVSPLLADRGITDLWNKKLLPIRNNVAFHFLSDGLTELLPTIKRDQYDFALGRGREKGGVYFPLADELALVSVLGEGANNAEFVAMLHATVKAAIRLADAFDAIIVEGLKELGWRGRTIPTAI